MPDRYKTIVADPPWDIAWNANMGEGRSGRKGLPYRTMSAEKIGALPVAELSADAAHLYLWTVLPMMAEAYDVVRAWGFRPSTVVTWCKPGLGMGGWRGNTEHLIVARKGTSPSINPTCAICGGRDRGTTKCECPAPEWRHMGRRVPPVEPSFLTTANGTWYQAPRSEHSAKPELFLDLIEQMSPGPYLEMFARRARFGWDYWGDQSLGTAEMAA